MADTTAEVKAILARAVRELDQVIDNPDVKSVLRRLAGLLGVEDDEPAAPTKTGSRRGPRAKPKSTATRASSARVALDDTAPPKLRTRTPARPTDAARGRARSGAPAARTSGRREQLLALVIDQPGITVAQAGKQFGIKDATGLYRVARRLQDDGLVRKRGAELYPTGKAQRS